MKINFYYRKPDRTHKSIELIFSSIAKSLRAEVDVCEQVSPYSSIGFSPRLKAIAWAYRQRNIADVHHVTGDVHFLVLGLPRKRTILTIHDLSFLKKGNWLSRFVLWLFWVYLPVWWVNKVTCVSETTKKDIVKYSFCRPGKVMVIPNFVPSGFGPYEKDFNEKYPLILQIGTAYNKNIERLTEALKGIPCTLRIIGHLSENHREVLRGNGINYSNVYDLANHELVDEYRKCDLLAFCSTVEGFGLPIIEAQTVGRAVITSNVSSMPEVAGDGACFINPLDIQSIKSGIERVIADRSYRETLINKGFFNAKRFNIDEISRHYIGLYKSIKT